MAFADMDRNQLIEQDIDPNACRALWCAVIEEQFRVALTPRRSDHPVEIAVARNWFGTQDFFEACALAGVDGAFILWGVRQHFASRGVL